MKEVDKILAEAGEKKADFVPVEVEEGAVERRDVEHHSHHSHHHHSHRHRSGSGHHRHRRHSSDKRNKKENKLHAFFRRNRKKLMNIAVGLLFALALLFFALYMDSRMRHGADANSDVSQGGEVTGTQTSLVLETPFFSREVSLVHPAVTAYINANADVTANTVFEEYRGEEELTRLDRAVPVTLSYAVHGIPEGYSVKKSVLYVAENMDFTNAKIYPLKNTETEVKVYNLKVATRYYYRFELTLSNGSVAAAEGSFETAATPRILSVDGVANVRDVGGWITASGQRIKQGLLYRGTELDGAVMAQYSITTTGVHTLLTEYGVRTDMDLRPASDNKTGVDALGAAVKHTYYAAPMYLAAFEPNGKQAMQAVFTDLADVGNYPVYLHCTHGLDRTGTVTYILQALLGVSEEDLMREYQLSSLHHGDLWALNQMKDFVSRFKMLDGATMQDKAETYLLSVGITEAQIESIRSIFLEQ